MPRIVKVTECTTFTGWCCLSHQFHSTAPISFCGHKLDKGKLPSARKCIAAKVLYLCTAATLQTAL